MVIQDGGVKDMTGSGVLDHLATKANAFRLAIDAVLTILRVDQVTYPTLRAPVMEYWLG